MSKMLSTGAGTAASDESAARAAPGSSGGALAALSPKPLSATTHDVSNTSEPSVSSRGHSQVTTDKPRPQGGDRLQTLQHMLLMQDQEVLQLRQGNNDVKSVLRNLERNYQKTIVILETTMKSLSRAKENYIETENNLQRQFEANIIINKELSMAVAKHINTLFSLSKEVQTEKVKSFELVKKLSKERDKALDHYASINEYLHDLLNKHKRAYSVTLEARDREEVFESLNNHFKQIAAEKLGKVKETLNNITKLLILEMDNLNANLQKQNSIIDSVHKSIIQVTRDNEELITICEQLVNEMH